MLKPLQKKSPENAQNSALVHHPCDALDSFGCYDTTNLAWSSFDDSVSVQIAAFEALNQRYIRLRPQLSRRCS
jgi:hypothetical protein